MAILETTVAICGHAQHGKSTLGGRLLFEFGEISADALQRRWESAPLRIQGFDMVRKGFNKYNILFLENRSATFKRGTDGIPDDPSRTNFPTRASISLGDRRLTLVDEPGYSRFIDNIVYGVYMADCAVLVVSASDGVDRGALVFSRLLSFFSVRLLCVCVTKMDEIGFSSERFGAIEEDVRQKILGPYFSIDTPVVPIYALSAAQRMREEERLSWFSGEGIPEMISDAVTSCEALGGSEVRYVVREVFSPPGVGTVLVGVLESGAIKAGDELCVEPESVESGNLLKLRCRSLQPARGVNEKPKGPVQVLHARAVVAFATNEVDKIKAERLIDHGAVLGREDSRPKVGRRIRAEIVFFEARSVYSGKEYPFSGNSARAAARVVSVKGRAGLIDDRHLDEYSTYSGEIVEAVLEFDRPVCIEDDPKFQKLTRFALREENEVVACGRCLEVL